MEATEPPGILVLLCDAVINLNAANKRGIFREAANVDTVRHFLSKLEAGELDCLLYASDGEGDSATAGADVVSDVLVACDLLKMWFRRLPQPIVPYACYAQCVRAGQRGDAALAQVFVYFYRLFRFFIFLTILCPVRLSGGSGHDAPSL